MYHTTILIIKNLENIFYWKKVIHSFLKKSYRLNVFKSIINSGRAFCSSNYAHNSYGKEKKKGCEEEGFSKKEVKKQEA